MFRIIFLILVLTNSVVFSQSTASVNSQPKKIQEFGAITDDEFGEKLDILISFLKETSGTFGHIINYGSKKEIAESERFIKTYLGFKNFDASRIVFINGGLLNKIKHELWIVPEGAATPKFSLKSILFDEFGKISQKELKLRTEKLRKKLQEKDSTDEGLRAYLIFYTDEKTITLKNEQNIIRDVLLSEDCRDCYGFGGPNLIFVDGGKLKEQKIQFWLSPRGADPPIPEN